MGNIIIKNSNVIVENTPSTNKKEERHFKKCFRLGKWRIYLTYNFRLKGTQSRDDGGSHYWRSVHIKSKLYEKNGHKCELCGRHIEYKQTQLHHVLPYHRFREFEFDERNFMCLCKDCHRSIHLNPFLDSKLQRKKAKQLGINLKKYYYND